MAVRVIHCGTGLTGTEALRAIIADPALELVGQYVTTPGKVGKDSGELVGLGKTGVIATDDLDELIGLQADCLCYAGNAVGRELEACEDMARFLRAGTNVVTFSVVAMCYPPTAPTDMGETVRKACEEGGTSFFATGIEPGTGSLNIPAALLSTAGRVTGYRMDEYALDLATVYPIMEVLRESMGFGKPDGFAPARLVNGIVQRWWTADVRFIADLLAVKLDDIEFGWETACTPHDITRPIGVIDAGTICAFRWVLAGMVGERPIVSITYTGTITADAYVPEDWPRPAPDTQGCALVFTIEGRPPVKMQLYQDQLPGESMNAGVVMTATSTVNAIPAVVEAGPGHLSPTDLPYYVTRDVDVDG
jgi:hypothetical protein